MTPPETERTATAAPHKAAMNRNVCRKVAYLSAAAPRRQATLFFFPSKKGTLARPAAAADKRARLPGARLLDYGRSCAAVYV